MYQNKVSCEVFEDMPVYFIFILSLWAQTESKKGWKVHKNVFLSIYNIFVCWRKKRTALILKLAAKSERQWQVIEPAALPPTRVNLERNTEEVPETNKTYMQLETENHVSPPADAGKFMFYRLI